MEPLYPNPGGVIDPGDLVGRVAELQRLQEAVSRVGAHVTGERRMGKTSVLAKLESALTDAGRIVLRISAETSDIDIFERRLVASLRAHRLVADHLPTWEREVGGEARIGIGSNGISLRGAARRAGAAPVERDLIDLLDSIGDSRGLVLIIDEITVLCQALGSADALELLRNLRAHRDGRSTFALVISGSIGLHHALSDTSPINDLWPVDIGPLTQDEASELAGRLLLGIGVDPAAELVSEISDATSRIPFYIHGVIDRLRQGERPDVELSEIDAIVDRCIRENTWHTEHYVTRIPDYYGEDAALARAVLDDLAVIHPAGRTLDEISDDLAARSGSRPERDRLIDLLGKLEKDHYLVCEGERDGMSSPLMARIWRIHRRL